MNKKEENEYKINNNDYFKHIATYLYNIGYFNQVVMDNFYAAYYELLHFRTVFHIIELIDEIKKIYSRFSIYMYPWKFIALFNMKNGTVDYYPNDDIMKKQLKMWLKTDTGSFYMTLDDLFQYVLITTTSLLKSGNNIYYEVLKKMFWYFNLITEYKGHLVLGHDVK